jgi:prepilin-type N-terminal cleavage/methylation domain-containing protein
MRLSASTQKTISRPGMTLVEMLVATAVTLILMGAIAQVFGMLGNGVTSSRSIIEVNDQLRMVSHRLRNDLRGLTAETIPPGRADGDTGYLEIIEGPASEGNSTTLRSGMDTTALLADCDDLLMLTTRSLEEPFIGRFDTASFESPAAEIAWFCKLAPTQLAMGPTLYTLYRRQLLISPYVGAGDFQTGNNAIAFSDWVNNSSWSKFYESYDLSCRLEGVGAAVVLLPNSLGDLTRRENRFMHMIAGGFPYNPTIPNSAGSANGEILTGNRLGEDVIMTNVIAFDIRVFDPQAPIRASSGIAAGPSDPGYSSASATGALGAYVDLGWAATGSTYAIGSTFPVGAAFQSDSMKVSNAPRSLSLPTAVYDTWSTHYESNGIDDDGNAVIDQGTNTIDDDSNGIVDDVAEQETSAPYPVPLRGIEVRIRCYEPSSQQVRQVTVRHTFVPH